MSWFFASKKTETPKPEQETPSYDDLVKRIEELEQQHSKDQECVTRLYYDGSLYQGMMKEDKPHGKGIFCYAHDGSRYVGEWENGLFHGEGVFYKPYYPALFGHWENHILHGEAWYDKGPKMMYEKGKLVL